MSFGDHTLSLHLRTAPSPPDSNSRWNGDCSCGRWVMRNHEKARIREVHAEHVQHELGPEVQEARANVQA